MCVHVHLYKNGVVEGILFSELKYIILNLGFSVSLNFRFNLRKASSFETIGQFLLFF